MMSSRVKTSPEYTEFQATILIIRSTAQMLPLARVPTWFSWLRIFLCIPTPQWRRPSQMEQTCTRT